MVHGFLHCLWLMLLRTSYTRVSYHKGYRCESPLVPCELIPQVYEPGPCIDQRVDGREGINVIFLVHATATVPHKNVQLMSRIVKDLSSYITMSYTIDYIRYASLTMCLFSETAKFVHLQRETLTLSGTLIDSAIREAIHNGENRTRIGNAFKKVEETLYSFWQYRVFAPNLCILLTTAPAEHTAQAEAAAQRLKEIGINIIVVAVGDGVDVGDVEIYASNVNAAFSTGKHMQYSDKEINRHRQNTAKKVMSTLRHGRILPRYEHCHNAYLNIFIVVDVGNDHVDMMLELRDFVLKFNLDHATIRVMITNSPVSDRRYMDAFRSALTAAHGVKFQTFKKYDLLSGIQRGREHLLDLDENDKKNVHEKILIVATDKTLWHTDDAISESEANQEAGIHVMALGIGDDVQENKLSLLVSDKRGIATVKTAMDLNFGLEKLNRNLCPPVCDKGWQYFDGMCYDRAYSKMPWQRAQERCGRWNSKLISITTAEKYAWLKTKFFHDTMYPQHIGLRRHEDVGFLLTNEFRWENGMPLVFTDWYSGDRFPEPDYSGYEECARWHPEGWRDTDCRTNQIQGSGFICEKEAGNVRNQRMNVRILPLWREKVCKNDAVGNQQPIIISGNKCRPLFDVHTKQDTRHVYTCSNGELISRYLVCDGLDHCLDGSDEVNCSTECTEDRFPCANGRCVSLAYFCDFWDDCGDNSDEADCVIVPCSANEWQCDSGQCIPEDARCDHRYDCYDKSDEMCSGLPCRFHECLNGKCIPSTWISDGSVDCAGGYHEDETLGIWEIGNDTCYTSRYRELFYLFVDDKYVKERPQCCMVFDGNGKRYGNWRDQDCKGDIFCPIGFYRCPSSYCIPIERVCDGVMDCIGGEDEMGCSNYKCPGYFRCPGSNNCHHPARICDGDADCPGGKDEVLCDYRCPDNCTCTAGFVECSQIVINESIPLDPKTRKIVLTNSTLMTGRLVFSHKTYFLREAKICGTGLMTLHKTFKYEVNLEKLNISFNRLSMISANVFTNLGKMKILDVSYNPIRKIQGESFAGLHQLEELYMRNTFIETLEPKSFLPLSMLIVLDVRGESIHGMSDEAFEGLHTLKSLYLQGNPIVHFGQRVYQGLQSLTELHTDVYHLCCPQVRSRFLIDTKCVSPKSSISSCNDLLASDILRSSIWLLCIASLIGNVVSIVMRLLWERSSMKIGFGVFVTHLGIADFLMGIYLLIIAVADRIYTGNYIWHDQKWRESSYCQTAGVLATISSEASALLICLITVDRFLVIKFPYGQMKFAYRSANVAAILVWMLALVIAFIPLFPWMAHWEFYTKNGACLALPYSTEKDPGWIYSALIFVGLNFVAFIFIGIGQVSIYRAMKEVSVLTSEKRRAEEMTVAQRLFSVVATDFICWVPIGIMSAMALSGISVGGEVYAWTAVFVLPVNSALNPFLYTIPAVLKKLKEKKKGTKTYTGYEKFGRIPCVVTRDPDPSLVLLEDVLAQLDTRENKLKLVQVVLNEVSEYLKAHTSVQPHAIYLGMRGKSVGSICLTTGEDAPNFDVMADILSLVSRQKGTTAAKKENIVKF